MKLDSDEAGPLATWQLWVGVKLVRLDRVDKTCAWELGLSLLPGLSVFICEARVPIIFHRHVYDSLENNVSLWSLLNADIVMIFVGPVFLKYFIIIFNIPLIITLIDPVISSAYIFYFLHQCNTVKSIIFWTSDKDSIIDLNFESLYVNQLFYTIVAHFS